MKHFCTYFDRNYIVKGLTLYRSLRAHAGQFTLWVLCFDDFTYRTLSKLQLPEVRAISLADFELGDSELAAAKATRSRVEYFFTCTPSLPLYVLRKEPDIELVTYLDSDLFFFSDPQPIFDELGNNSILIVEHRFPRRLQHLEANGIYNVGIVSFRNDDAGRECLNWWRERCIEWCYDRAEPGRYGDQKYLDDWPTRFKNVVVLQHKGANLAPWNWMKYEITERGGSLSIDGDMLVVYHFHQLKLLNPWLCEPGISVYEPRPFSIPRQIYRPYLHALTETCSWAQKIVPEIEMGYTNRQNSRYSTRAMVRTLGRSLVRGQVLVSVGPFVL